MYCIMNQAEIKAIIRYRLSSSYKGANTTIVSNIEAAIDNNIDMEIPPKTVFSVSFAVLTLRWVPRHRWFERKRESEPIA